jgi:hypothetical protein
VTADGRDPILGRFVPGRAGGLGRPRKPRPDYLKALTERVPLERWQRIVETATQLAESGDPKARDWLTNHLVGRPTEKIDLRTEKRGKSCCTSRATTTAACRSVSGTKAPAVG